MSDKNLSTELAACLEWMEKSGQGPQKAAERFPHHYQELVNLLQTVEQLETAEKPLPSREFQFAARTRLLNQIKAKKSAEQATAVTNDAAGRHIWQSEKLRRDKFSQHPPKRRFAMNWILIIGLIASVFAGGGGVAYASTDSLPGDTLYPVKTMLQDMEMIFANDEADAQILMNQMFNNIEEMQQLAAQGRYDDIVIGLEEYQNNLTAMNQVRTRVNYDEAGTEDSLNLRLQEQLQTCAQLLEQLQTQLQTQEQLKIQEKVQEAIQLTETGNTYGPNEDAGQPEEPGDPNGVGPGEPQGPGDQQPDDAANPNAECQGDNCGQPEQPGGPNPDSGSGQDSGEGSGSGGDSGQGGNKKP